MAHPNEKRTELRGLYVYQRMAMEAACKKLSLPRGTANRWKQDAADKGDDWDTARSAVAMGDESFNNLAKQLLEDYLLQHQATMKSLREDTDLSALERAETLASLSDSFNKTMNSFRRLNPEINRQSVGLDVLQRLAQFAQTKHPKHVPALLALLEPFGEELARAYG
jgi:hypothetical protein